MTLILIVSTLSIMIFYSAVITVNIHKTLDRENAGKALRVLFPSYFLTISIISFMALITSIINIDIFSSVLLSLVFLGSVYSRQYLVPQINKARDLQVSGDIASKKTFSRIHGLSVSINLIQMIILIILVTKNTLG